MQPLISVIIPCYNAEKYIADTLLSVKNQSYANYEILVIDDGSTDNSGSIILHAAKSEPRISYYHQQNKGVSAARNKGLSLCKGDYIAFLDADDYWEPANLEKKVNALLGIPSPDWVFSDIVETDGDLKIVRSAPSGQDNNHLSNLLLWEKPVVPLPCSNVIFKRKLYEEGCVFDTMLSITADLDFCIQLASHSDGYRLPLPLVRYRIVANSMSHNKSKSVALMEHDQMIIHRKAVEAHLFSSRAARLKSLSNNYLVLAGSWWIDGKNKKKGFPLMLKALLLYPPAIFKLSGKIFRRFFHSRTA